MRKKVKFVTVQKHNHQDNGLDRQLFISSIKHHHKPTPLQKMSSNSSILNTKFDNPAMNYESSYSDSLGDSRFDKIQKQEKHTVGKVISKIDMKWVYFTSYGLILIYKTMRWFFYTLGGHPSGVTFSSGALGFLMDFGLFSLILYVTIYACMVLGMNRKKSALVLPMVFYSCCMVIFWIWNFLLLLAVAIQEIIPAPTHELKHVDLHLSPDDILGARMAEQVFNSNIYNVALFSSMAALLMGGKWAVVVFGLVQYRKHIRSNF